VNGQDLTMAAALVDALPDLGAEIELRSRAAREAYERGRATGAAEEHERQLAEEAQRRREMAALVPGARPGTRSMPFTEIDRCRWIVRGEERTRATFGRPHPDDYQGIRARRDEPSVRGAA
jgi:hypothetical protein